MDQKLETFLTLCKTMHYGRAAELLHARSLPSASTFRRSRRSTVSASLRTRLGGCRRHGKATFSGGLLFLCATTKKCFSRVFTKNQRLCSASARQNPSAIIFCCRKSAAFLQNRTSSFTFLSTTRPIFSQNSEDGELDFVVLEGLFDKQRYDFFLLREEPYLGMRAADHPFAESRSPSRISSPSA